MNHLLSTFLLLLVLGTWPPTVTATELFSIEGSTLLPLDYMNTTGMIDLDYPVSIGGKNYTAMEISTSGIIFFYTMEWEIAVVAPLASDIDLSCPAPSTENLACYNMTEDPDLLAWAESIIANRTMAKSNKTSDDYFNPRSLIIATWNKVQRYGCPEDLKTNTFQAVIATGTRKNQTQSYAIFLYSELEWMDENAVAGVIDGRGRPLFVLALTPAVIKSQSGVFVVALNSYWYTYQASAATEDAMGHGDTSKLSAHSAKQRKPLDVLQQSIDLYLK